MQNAQQRFSRGVVAWGVTEREVRVKTSDRRCPQCLAVVPVHSEMLQQVQRIRGFIPSMLSEWAGYVAWRCNGVTSAGTCPLTFWLPVSDEFLHLVKARGGWFATNFFRP